MQAILSASEPIVLYFGHRLIEMGNFNLKCMQFCN